VPQADGIEEIVIFHDGENLHTGPHVCGHPASRCAEQSHRLGHDKGIDRPQALYSSLISGIRQAIGFSAKAPPDLKVAWNMYITHKAKDPRFYPSSVTLTTLNNAGVTVVFADAKSGDVDVKMTRGIDEYFEKERRTVEMCGGDLQVVARKRLIVICT
jgi:hypothetical protein